MPVFQNIIIVIMKGSGEWLSPIMRLELESRASTTSFDGRNRRRRIGGSAQDTDPRDSFDVFVGYGDEHVGASSAVVDAFILFQGQGSARDMPGRARLPREIGRVLRERAHHAAR